MTATAHIIETTFSTYTTEDHERSLTVVGTYEPEQYPHVDEYFRPTECGTDEEIEIETVILDGIEYDGPFDDVFASQFWYYCYNRRTYVRHTWETLKDEIEIELKNEL